VEGECLFLKGESSYSLPYPARWDPSFLGVKSDAVVGVGLVEEEELGV
jgi:hypothetical protein